jgi:hypothetical protein
MSGTAGLSRWPVGLVLKRLVLVFGATYLAMVCVTNLVNFSNAVAGTHVTFLNSQNSDYIASIVKVYSVPHWFDEVAVLGAAFIEGIGAVLFVRALRGYRGGGVGISEVYQALTWNIGVWFAFIVGTEFFIAYPSEAPFRELLGLALLMTVVITLVPDSPSPADPLGSPRTRRDAGGPS